MPSSHSAAIRVKLRDLAQLFNSMDPSPFLDRDLDRDAEDYIVGAARELPGRPDIALIIHLTEAPPAARIADVEGAVQHYFATRAEMKRKELRLLMRRGRTSLVVGLMFLVSCLVISELLEAHGNSTIANIVKESLDIGGWVAMWRPLEIYLYDWWPLRDERRIFERLSRMKVRLELPPAH